MEHHSACKTQSEPSTHFQHMVQSALWELHGKLSQHHESRISDWCIHGITYTSNNKVHLRKQWDPKHTSLSTTKRANSVDFIITNPTGKIDYLDFRFRISKLKHSLKGCNKATLSYRKEWMWSDIVLNDAAIHLFFITGECEITQQSLAWTTAIDELDAGWRSWYK